MQFYLTDIYYRIMSASRALHFSEAEPIVTGVSWHVPGAWANRPDGLREWLIIYTISGSAVVRSGSVEHVVAKNDLLLIRPGVPQDYGTTPGVDSWLPIWAVFDAPSQWQELLSWPEVAEGHGVLHISESLQRGKVRRHLLEMHHMATLRMPRRIDLAMNSLHAALLWCDAINPRAQAGGMDGRLGRLIDHITQHLNGDLPVDSLAKFAGVSRPQLNRLFSRYLGSSPREFVEAQRLHRAVQLLRNTGLSISAIAWEVGFESPFYFSRRFHRVHGVSPSQYRRAR